MQKEQVIYSELTRMRWYAPLALAVSLLLLVGGFFVHVLLFVTGLLGIPASVLLFSAFRHNRILLTERTLQVGVDSVPIAEIDLSFAPATEEDHRSSGGSPVMSFFNTTGVGLLGGGYERPLWARAAIIRKTDGTLVAIASLNRDAFIAALGSLLKAQRAS